MASPVADGGSSFAEPVVMHLMALPAVLLLFGSIPLWTELQTSDAEVVHLDPGEAADVLRRITSGRGSVVVDASTGLLRIVDFPSVVDRLTRVLREIDRPGCGCEWRPGPRRDETEQEVAEPIELPVGPSER